MSYQANIPAASDKLKNSQADILGNFQAIKTLIDINHETFGSAVQGKHKYVSMPVQGAAPVTTASEGALYTKTSALTSTPELFFRRESSGTEMSCTEASFGTGGWAKIPCGMLLKWGYVAGMISGSHAFTFAVGPTIPVFSACYIMLTSCYGSAAIQTVAVEALSNVGFTLYSSTGGSFYWLALGN